jgi:hypothetical protein
MRYRLLVRCGEINPSASHDRKAEDEMPRRAATSEMRKRLGVATESDSLEKFFLLDTAPGFL